LIPSQAWKSPPFQGRQLEIVDDGDAGPVEVDRGGHGLVGRRERDALYGGTLDAGRCPAGGFMLKDAPPEEIAAAVRRE
jgi:glucose-6-phosphate-specific signal transduction histidine kinase